MKILYIVPTIHDEGGVPKVLSIKTKELIERFSVQISILTLPTAQKDTFFPFPENVHNIVIQPKGWKVIRILDYFKKIKKHIETYPPDCIVICDFGWKGFCFNKFVKTKVPVIFEVHGSLYNETKKINYSLLSKLRAFFRQKLLASYDNIVYLSEESKKEWQLPGIIIPNPVPKSNYVSELKNPNAIAVARHSYEKGIDRLLQIWQKVSRHSNWTLSIYGDGYLIEEHQKQIQAMGLEHCVQLMQPVKDIFSKYAEASIFVMTSRTEAFPMALLEAMEIGLPVVVYDCPIGPRVIVQNNVSGFLIPEENEDEFVSKLIVLQNDPELRSKMGNYARETMKELDSGKIANYWYQYFRNLVANR